MKSSQIEKPGWPDPKDGTPTDRFNKWIDEAATGFLTRQRITAEDQEFAIAIQKLLKPGSGYTVDHKVMQVTIPKPTATGTPLANLFDWL